MHTQALTIHTLYGHHGLWLAEGLVHWGTPSVVPQGKVNWVNVPQQQWQSGNRAPALSIRPTGSPANSSP